MNTSIYLSNAPEKEALGIPSASKAIALLYEKAADHLTDAELDWFADSMREQTALELSNVSRIVEATALVVANCNLSLAMQDETTLATFLFSLSNQLDAITGFMKIGDEAAYRLKVKADQAKSQA